MASCIVKQNIEATEFLTNDVHILLQTVRGEATQFRGLVT
jgi:hypothetical protein